MRKGKRPVIVNTREPALKRHTGYLSVLTFARGADGLGSIHELGGKANLTVWNNYISRWHTTWDVFSEARNNLQSTVKCSNCNLLQFILLYFICHRSNFSNLKSIFSIIFGFKYMFTLNSGLITLPTIITFPLIVQLYV